MQSSRLTAPRTSSPNHITFDDASARVWILTGPNRAGKTTYTRAVGLAQILFQAGLYVPASSARLSPVDAIYTHFPSHEQAHPGMGRPRRGGRAAGRDLQAGDAQSLVLLNETLAGTAASEAEGLARDAVRGLRLLGARAVYVTHLHDLATAVDEINATTPGASLVGSLVADADDEEDSAIGPLHRRTYRIHPGIPRGRSYASEIARRYGISFAQLAVLMRERGISPADPTTAHPHRREATPRPEPAYTSLSKYATQQAKYVWERVRYGASRLAGTGSDGAADGAAVDRGVARSDCVRSGTGVAGSAGRIWWTGQYPRLPRCPKAPISYSSPSPRRSRRWVPCSASVARPRRLPLTRSSSS